MQAEVIPVSGLMKFDNVTRVRQYIKELLSYYERQFDIYSQKVATLMREYETNQKGKPVKKLSPDNWRKVGMLMVNTRDPLLGTLEIMLDAMEEYKVKLTRTKEVLVGFDDLDALPVQPGSPLTLYLRNGVPMRIVFSPAANAVRVDSIKLSQR